MAQKRECFVCEARGSSQAQPADLLRVRQTLDRLWALKFENTNKEPYWRLVIDGFPGFSMHRSQLGGPGVAVCPCGTRMSTGDRAHHFWDCGVARALWFTISDNADELNFDKHHLWLVEPPRGIVQPVWDVVCMAAIAALESGRRCLYAARCDEGISSNVLNRIKVQTVADFWARLHSFAALGTKPRNWGAVPSNHPWLRRNNDGNIVVQRVLAEVEMLDDSDN
jgi:hypothetical protein